MSIGDNVKALREKAGMTQEELGKRLGGVTKGWVSFIERGHEVLSLRRAEEIAEIFNVTIIEVVKGDKKE